jgi:hypothetical protein
MAFKPPAVLPDYSKLDTSLNASGVQSWNPELYAILKQLIAANRQSQDAITGVSGGSSFVIETVNEGANLEYLGNYVTPHTYNDGDIVVGSDGIAYLCTKDGTTTPPESWPGSSSGTVLPPHHATHEKGGTDEIANVAWLNIHNTFTQAQDMPQLGIIGAGSQLFFYDLNAPAGKKAWRIKQENSDGFLFLEALSDDLSSLTGNPVMFGRDNTTSFNGQIILGTGQIRFPSVPNPSTDVNTLDVYKEGIWGPTDQSGAGLILTYNAQYIKIGRHVTVTANIAYPSNTNGSAVNIGGLPFAAHSFQPGGVLREAYPAIPGTPILSYVRENTQRIELFSEAGAAITNTQLSTKVLYLSGTYIAGT